jgi:deoxyribose-phosphate aldolase
VKAYEAETVLRLGANELDMVLNIGALCDGEYNIVLNDIRGVAEMAHRDEALVKVILETALLDDVQKGVACALASMAHADFVKTSTGFGPSGATVHDVALIRAVTGPNMGVKASGGIRTDADFRAMFEAGANRIGTSAGVRIVSASAPDSAVSRY